MGRLRRLDAPGAWHHVVNRGAGGQRVFFTRADGERFESFLEQSSSRGTVEVHAYCLMPNHFHLLLHCPDAGLSPFMQYVVSGYTRSLNRRRRRDGPLFRSRFRSVPIDQPEQLAWAGRYIHLNPVDLIPAPDPVTYRWSSLRGYADARSSPPWLHRDALLGMFESGASGYLDFVLSGGAPGVDALVSAIEHAVDERIDADPNVRRRLVECVQAALLAGYPTTSPFGSKPVCGSPTASRACVRSNVPNVGSSSPPSSGPSSTRSCGSPPDQPLRCLTPPTQRLHGWSRRGGARGRCQTPGCSIGSVSDTASAGSGDGCASVWWELAVSDTGFRELSE